MDPVSTNDVPHSLVERQLLVLIEIHSTVIEDLGLVWDDLPHGQRPLEAGVAMLRPHADDDECHRLDAALAVDRALARYVEAGSVGRDLAYLAVLDAYRVFRLLVEEPTCPTSH